MEAAREVVVDAARRHRVERADDHVEGCGIARPSMVAQQEEQLRRLRKLRTAAEATVLGVERRGDLLIASVERRHARRHRAIRGRGRRLEPLHDVGRGRIRACGILRIDVGQLSEELEKPELLSTHACPRREIRARVERLPVRREPQRHRPSAVAIVHELDGVHVDGIEVRPLLAVHLDRDVALVQDLRDLEILERFLLHHVAPVAGRVADREQDRLLLVPRLGEGLVGPGVPVDGVVGMLAEVGARFFGETVREGGGAVGVQVACAKWFALRGLMV